MTTHHPSPRPIAEGHTLEDQETSRGRFVPSWRLLTLAAEVGALLLVALAVGLLLSSCSGEKSATEDELATQTTVSQSPENNSSVHPTAVVAQSGGVEKPALASSVPVSNESLPPDIVVTASDTLVEPGAVVEITARATGDVAEIALWDGIHDRQAFVYDATEGVWRASYRVPLQPKWERLGLSVTAKNVAQRWRRVWVFLSTGVETPETQDSTSG